MQCPIEDVGSVICKQISTKSVIDQTKMNFILQYPYNDFTKVCWENSPEVPKSSTDSICALEHKSLLIDDKTQKRLVYMYYTTRVALIYLSFFLIGPTSRCFVVVHSKSLTTL